MPVRRLKSLSKINLAHCGLKDTDIPCLQELEELAHLNLDSCSIGEELRDVGDLDCQKVSISLLIFSLNGPLFFFPSLSQGT